MSDQFYNYLSNRLSDFFEDNLIAGDKFYIEFDNNQQVESFYNSLKKRDHEKFTFIHKEGNPYTTFFITFNEVKLIVASSKNTTAGFLVTLRNQLNQNNDLSDYALLIICSSAIDSIQDGMGNLLDKDLPFNLETISSNLKDEIDNSNLSNGEKEILKFYLRKKEEDSYQNNLWDYEDVLAVLNSGVITREEYINFGLFFDENLNDFSIKNIKDRISENNSMYEKIWVIKESNQSRKELEKKFDQDGVRELDKDIWQTLDYSFILRHILPPITPIQYIENPDKQTYEGLTYWEKYKSKISGPKYFIIFNETKQTNISFDLQFDSQLYIDRLDPKIDGVKTSGKKIKIDFEIDGAEINFKRFNYNHNNKSKFKFYILVLPFSEEIFESVQTNFSIKSPRINSKKFTLTISKNDETIFFGKGINKIFVKIDENQQDLSYSSQYLEDNKIYISEKSLGWEEDSLDFNLRIDDVVIPISIEEKDKRDFPVKSIELWKLKRENKDNFIFNDIKVIQGSRVLYILDVFKNYLRMEENIVNNDIFYGIKKFGNEIEKHELNLSDTLKSSYQDILNYYKEINNVPSLVYLNDELRVLYENFINIFNEEIETIKETTPLDAQNEKFDLFKIGMIKDHDKILFSSLSPINIAYQLEVMNQCENEILEKNILERLIPNNIVPYIFGEGNDSQLLTPVYQTDAHEWLIYEKNEKVSLGVSNAFISSIVSEKIEQFITHFDYLFNLNIKSPIKLNIINIYDDTEFVKGIFDFYYKILIGKSNIKFIPIEVNIYSNQEKCSLDEFFECESNEDLFNLYEIKIDEKKIDAYEAIRLIQENIRYYKYPVDVEQYGYAHISFYKSGFEEQSASQNMSVINTGLSLNGLISSVNSNNDSKYKKGFGTKDILNYDNPLVRTSINLNELCCNLEKNGINAYNKGYSIVSIPPQIKSDTAKNLYDVSHWVTFIEPNLDLEFFDDEDSKLIIIHYSDQYTSSSRYDTITVTNKSNQYENIIKEFLKTKDLDINKQELKDLIKMFNSINGEWLLRTISNDISDEREKLSIISAVKYGLAILEHPEITWIPISMEEILRIAGNVKLDRNNGVFTIKTLKENGVHSDDLLFIGVRILDNGKIKLYYYPIEVKIGKNFSPVINKGKKQIQNSYKLFREQLNQYDLENKFRNRFFRNFFIQVLLSNEQKLSVNHIWDDKFKDKFDSIKKNLLNDDYEISYNLESVIGIGSVISFATDNTVKRITSDENIQIIDLTEYDAYSGLKTPIEDLCKKIQSGDTDIPKEILLSACDLDELDEQPIPPVDSPTNPPQHIISSGGESTPQPTDDENLKIYNEFLENQAGNYITNENGELIISRVIKGDKQLFGKFNSMEIARDYEQKLIKNAWDFKLSDNVGTYGKFIRKEGNKFVIIRKIKGKNTRFGPYDSLNEALIKRESLIDDNWGVDGDVNFVIEGIYGKYITFFNDVFLINRTIDGDLYNFGKFDTLEDANTAKDILIANGWDGFKIPEELFSWRFFSTYIPKDGSWEVSNLIGENFLSFGFFPSKKNAKKAINILIENKWDSSFVPLELYSKRSNIRIFKNETIFQVFRRINGERVPLGTFDTLEEAIEFRNQLFLSNWVVDKSEEEKYDEYIYLKNEKFYVKNEIDNERRIFGVFDTFDEALECRYECMKNAWNLPYEVEKSNHSFDFLIEEESDEDLDDLSSYLNKELMFFELERNPKNSQRILFEDILDIFNSISTLSNPDFPVPQENSFNRILDLCEKLYDDEILSKNEICDMFDLKNRPYRYLISAGQYIGLIDQLESGVKLSNKGLKIYSLDFKEKYLAIAKSILETKLFNEIFAVYLENNEIPSIKSISKILVDYNITGATLARRASTIRHWITWIVSLCEK